MTFNPHPLRQRLNDEIHARPPVPLKAPPLVSLLAFLHGELAPNADRLGTRAGREGITFKQTPYALEV